MTTDSPSLMTIFSGWDGYQTSLARAISLLTREQLAYRPVADRRSVGEIAAHIAFGRIDWFHRMGAPGADELARDVESLERGGKSAEIADDAAEIVRWLDLSWRMVEDNLKRWTIDDLSWTYLQPYGDSTYVVSRQWVIWRIMAHDIHHGGQLTILLGELGIDPPDLGDNGGHIIEPPIAGE